MFEVTVKVLRKKNVKKNTFFEEKGIDDLLIGKNNYVI
jgi:hypothetical protein